MGRTPLLDICVWGGGINSVACFLPTRTWVFWAAPQEETQLAVPFANPSAPTPVLETRAVCCKYSANHRGPCVLRQYPHSKSEKKPVRFILTIYFISLGISKILLFQ